jgi:hypothetical protein
LRIEDRKMEKLATVKGIPLASFGWFVATSDDSLLMARDNSMQEVYALDWDMP